MYNPLWNLRIELNTMISGTGCLCRDRKYLVYYFRRDKYGSKENKFNGKDNSEDSKGRAGKSSSKRSESRTGESRTGEG